MSEILKTSDNRLMVVGDPPFNELKEKANETITFGPTETENYLLCPTLRRFYKNWEQRGPWKPYLAVGAAMSECLAVYLKDPGESSYEAALNAARGILEARYEESVEWKVDGLFTLLERGFEAAVKTTLAEILQKETVLGTEVTIDRGRIDFVSSLKTTQDIVVTDHKVSIQIQPRYVEGKMKETALNWQLWDYLWRATQYYGRPARYIRRHLIILSPKARALCSDLIEISPARLEQWAKSATCYWGTMKHHDELSFNELPMNHNQCENRYGRCPAYVACHELLRDEKAMEAFYDRKN